MALREMVVLDDATLRSMAVNQQFTSEFPFLSAVAAKTGSCGRCSRNRATAQAQNLDAVKRTLTAMTADKKKRLLQLLNTKQVRLRYREGNQIVVKTIKSA
jgi:hypothetical protein